MRRISALVGLLPSLALAQQPALLSPQVQACQQTILQLTGDKLEWQTQAIALQRHIDDLNKQLASVESKPEPPKP